MNLIKNFKKFVYFFAVSLMAAASISFAAPLTYNSDTIISLSSPVINFTIQSGSVADSVVVNAGDVVVSMSTSTGGSFTLTSALADVVVSTSASEGNVQKTCSGRYSSAGIMTVVITHASGEAATYTITPSDSQCMAPAFSGGVGYQIQQISSSAPISDSASTATASSTVASVATTTASSEIQSLEEKIMSLQILLKSLTEQVSQKGLSSSIQTLKFTRDLYYGLTGDDVKLLQNFLIEQNKGPKALELNKVGATGKFYGITKNALIEFQKKSGISPAAGYFGPKTRAYIQALIQ